MVSLVPARKLPLNADVTLRLAAGAKPRPENYGTNAEITRTFHTLEPLALRESSLRMARSGATAQLHFNHPLKQDSVEGNLAVDVPGYPLDNDVDVSGSWIFITNLPAEYESSITIRLLRSLADAYGQLLGTDQAVSLDVGPAASYVYFRGTGQGILEAQFPPKVAVEMQNVDAGHSLVARLPGPYAPRPKTPNRAHNAQSIARNTRHCEIFDLAPFLDACRGTACLSWSCSGLLWGSDTPQEASSLATGAPLADAAVTFRKDARTISAGRTDAKGVAALALAPGILPRTFTDDQHKAEIEIAKGKDRLVLRPSDMPGRTWNAEEPFSAEKARPLTFLWSSRGIYRPGATISFAGMDRDLVLGKLLPAKGRFRVDLVNGSDDGAAAASVSGTTSETGSFSGRLVLPQNGNPGDWPVVFHRLRGAEDPRTGTAYVQVANFRRVTFAVDLELPDKRAFMGDTLTASFSGASLAGGSIRKGSWSWFWTRRETWYPPPGDALADYTVGDVEKGWAEDAGSDSGTITGDGVVTASQKLEDGDKGRAYSHEISATVEDIDRQAISKSASRLVFASQQLVGAKVTADARSDASLYLVTPGTTIQPQGGLRRSGRQAPALEPRYGQADPRRVDTCARGLRGGRGRHPLRAEPGGGAHVQRPGGSFGGRRVSPHAEIGVLRDRAQRPGREGTPELHAAHVLLHRMGRDRLAADGPSAARAKGMKLPPEIDTGALLDYIDKEWENQDTYLQAYALSVLSTWGRPDAEKAALLAGQGDHTGVFGYCFLGLAYDEMGDVKSATAVLTRLKNFVRPGKRTVTLVGTVDDRLWYGGDLQAKALLLMLYARLQAFAEIIGRGGEAAADFTGVVTLRSTDLARRAFKGLSRAPFARRVPAGDLASIAGAAGAGATRALASPPTSSTTRAPLSRTRTWRWARCTR